ncbi:MAG: PTS fructose transporter subunit IIA [Burkholderiaceae bacterium]
MPGLFVIAHAPLATALKAVAQHTFPDCAARLFAFDVSPEMSVEAAEVGARALRAAAPAHQEWLMLTDAFGATPCNAARRLLDAEGRRRLVSGVNVPMVWRSLCYGSEPLDALVHLAAEGGKAGVVIADIPENPSQSPESS